MPADSTEGPNGCQGGRDTLLAAGRSRGTCEVKVLLQRVTRSAVRVRGSTVAEIGAGLVVFVGVEVGDTPERADWLADKAADVRVFADDEGRMNRSVVEVGGAALVVSQFTLAASTRRGRRPSYDRAASPDLAESLYLRFADRLRARGVRVELGQFRAMMEVELVNDGPVTLLLDPPPERS
jgi:D-tyrosyl-tRNA(Tyr) deacylase